MTRLKFLVGVRSVRDPSSVNAFGYRSTKATDHPLFLSDISGMVLLGEYRGTAVAVKRVIPQQNDDTNKKGGRDSIFGAKSQIGSGIINKAASWAGLSFSSMVNLSFGMGRLNSELEKAKRNKGPSSKQLKEEFLKEMRYLSKLRHPCVTTVMGAFIDKGDDPMVSTKNAFEQHISS